MTTQTITPETQQLIDRIMERISLVSGRHPEGFEYIDLETVERVLRDELAE